MIFQFERSAAALALTSCLLVVSACSSGGSSPQASGPDPVGLSIAVEPAAGIAFDPQIVGTQSPARTITARNTGSSSIEVTNLTSSLPQFAVVAGPALPATVAAGASVQIDLTFSPDSDRAFAGELVVSATSLPNARAPLTGTGRSPMTVTPGFIGFADQIVSSSSAGEVVTIANTGAVDMRLTALSVAAPFEIVANPAPTTVAAGTNLMLEVIFSPTAVGDHSLPLVISHESLSDQNVQLSGTAISGIFSIVSTSLPDATAGSPYFADIYTESAALPIAWNLAPGDNLPPGLSLEPTTGRVFGTPTVIAESVFTVEAEDSGNPMQSDSRTISLRVAGQTGANCDNITTDRIFPAPMVQLEALGSGFYMGEQGGRYPGGSNLRPAAHTAWGTAQTGAVEPLNAGGNPDPGGSVVLLSIGMSNTTMEFNRFMDIANADPDKNPDLVIVDGAQSAQSAENIRDPNASYWGVVDSRLSSAGITPEQVQILWIKTANGSPTPGFPGHALELRDHIADIVRIIKSRYPNARIAYLSNRTYGGYSNTNLNPEPFAYETGFAVKWLLEQQILDQGNLNYDPSRGTVVAPWLDWGPGLWADGLNARADRLVWTCQDFGPDGTHPSGTNPTRGGRLKVANLLLEFLKTDPLARQWFLANP